MVAWSTTDKSANVTLSAFLGTANIGATFTSASQGAVRCDTSITAKTYVEFWLSAGANWLVGFANATFPLTTQLGNTNDGWVANASQNIRINNGNFGQLGLMYLGCCIGLAFDPVGKLVWVSLNGGNWNNSATADPGTGVGGVSISTINAGPYFPCFSSATNGAAVIGRFGTGDFAYPVPSGFAAMDTNVQAFEAVPKITAYALYNIPQAAESVFKLVSYSVLNIPQSALSVFKLVSYAILQPPPTNGRFDYSWPLPKTTWPKRWLDLGGSQGSFPPTIPYGSSPFVGTITDAPIRWKRSANDNYYPHGVMAKSQINFAYLLLASM